MMRTSATIAVILICLSPVFNGELSLEELPSASLIAGGEEFVAVEGAHVVLALLIAAELRRPSSIVAAATVELALFVLS
jgi:hypothetical protein